MFKRLTAMALFVVTVFTCSAGAAIRSDDYYRQQLGDEAYEQMMEDYQKDLEENGIYTDVPYDHWRYTMFPCPIRSHSSTKYILY